MNYRLSNASQCFKCSLHLNLNLKYTNSETQTAYLEVNVAVSLLISLEKQTQRFTFKIILVSDLNFKCDIANNLTKRHLETHFNEK